MNFLKKHYSNIIFIIVIALLLIPQTRMPVQVFIQRLFSFSPKEIKEDKRETLNDYSWPLQTISGESVNFSDSKNKVIVLNHWATWCPPCVAEMPSLQKLFDGYGAKADFYFVANDEMGKVKTFLTKKGYTIPVYFENGEAPALLKTQSLPTTFVIDKKGKIAMHITGAADWNNDKVHQLLDKLLNE